MQQLYSDLWQTEVESPFPGLTTHAYLLRRDDGNVLFYNSSQQADLEQMATLGGVQYHFLSHKDELGESINTIRARFGARLGGHVKEQAEFSVICRPDILFSKREFILDNVEVIPTPGHTPGSCCFLVCSPHGKTYLFSGDTVYLTDDSWKPGWMSFSQPEELKQSLSLLATLEPDVVFSSAFSGQNGFEEVSGHWPTKLRPALERLASPPG